MEVQFNGLLKGDAARTLLSLRAQGHMVERVMVRRIIPRGGDLAIYLVGNLAPILDLCTKKNPGAVATGVQITLVAGAHNHRELTLCVPV